jgi:hypothetical protein
MAKAKPVLALTGSKLANYRFDTSTYIVIGKGNRKNTTTGKLTERKPASNGNKPKSD